MIESTTGSTSPGISEPTQTRSGEMDAVARQPTPLICTPTAPGACTRVFAGGGGVSDATATVSADCASVMPCILMGRSHLNSWSRPDWQGLLDQSHEFTSPFLGPVAGEGAKSRRDCGGGQEQDSMVRRIAVSTGGGDCPGLNAVIRAVVTTAIGDYGIEVFGIETGFDGLMGRGGARVRPLTLNVVRGILPEGGTILGTSNRGSPFAMPREGGGTVDRSQEIVDRLDELGIDTVVSIGGDGSMRIAAQLGELGVKVVGVPKTIDNDLLVTDVTFGFDSALQVATEAIDRLHSTADSHHRVMVVEVMGRNAGWIALHAGIAGGADIILLPEIPYRTEAVVQALVKRARTGRKSSIVVVAEGAVSDGGDALYLDRPASTHTVARRLGGVGNQIAEDIAEACGADTRATVLGHVQRGGSPSPFDRVLGTRFGCAAAHLVARGGHGRMVALRGADVIDCAIVDAIAEPKLVDPEGELVRAAKSVGVSFGT